MPVTKRKARIGIIGCGRIARQGHLPYLRENPNVELAAVMDVNVENRMKLCKSFGIGRDCGEPDEMFDKAQLDGVLICTPNWVHRDLTLMAAERGVHVFCEKPMACNAAEAGEMVAACERAGVNLQVGMAKRFDAGIVKAKKMVKSGALGNVSQIITSCLTPPPPKMDSPFYETVKKWAAAIGKDIEADLGLWRMTDERTGGGHLLEMGTHLLDLILFFADEHPSEWSGYTNSNRSDMVWEDQGTLLMKFPSGVIASAEMNMCVTADNLIGENGRIYGDKASLSFKYINGMWFGMPYPLYHYVPTPIFLYGPLSLLTGIGIPVPAPVGKKTYMHKLQMDYFVDGILGRDTDYYGIGPDFAAHGGDGLAVMKIIDTAYKKASVCEEKSKPAPPKSKKKKRTKKVNP